jgi:hypothetical protein
VALLCPGPELGRRGRLRPRSVGGVSRRSTHPSGKLKLADYPYLAASRAELLRRLDRPAEATVAYEEALMLTENEVEREYLAVAVLPYVGGLVVTSGRLNQSSAWDHSRASAS